ncbi:ATP-binding cassette domain-containing protein [Mesorhizobium sp. 10J20-29]
MTAGMIFAASLISGRALQPIDQIIGSWRQLAAGREAWKRVQAFMEKADLRDEYTSLPAPNGLLVANDIVQFNPSDPTKPPILAGISFSLKPGESVAVLGPSGSGKSTLARILVGAATPRAGHVRIDGHDISNWNPEDLGRHIGYLSQDVELVPGTIAQNISRFDPNPSDEAIVAAAHAAHVVDVIQRMPRGYDTSIGPGGVQVSGGEKQLIGLARALYGSPRILVLDEPDASLDRSGELALMRALSDAHKRGVTVFIITQRERVLAGVDKIMRMQNGKLLDYDTRDKVFERFRDAGSRAGDPGSGPSRPLEGQAIDGKSVPQT